MARDNTNLQFSSSLQPYDVIPHQTQSFLLINSVPAAASSRPYPQLNTTVFDTSEYGSEKIHCGLNVPVTPVNSQAQKSLENVSKSPVSDIETLGETDRRESKESRKRVCHSSGERRVPCCECKERGVQCCECKERGVQCSECGECHATPRGLASHLATQHHHCIQTYKCLYCPHVFLSKHNLLGHVKSVLLDKQPSPVHVAGMISCAQHTCPACARVHVSAQNLKMHLVKNKCDVVGLSSKCVVDERAKLRCMKLVLQSYKPRVVRLKCDEVADSSNTGPAGDHTCSSTSNSRSVPRTEPQSVKIKPNPGSRLPRLPRLTGPDKEDNSVMPTSGSVPQHCRLSQINQEKGCVPTQYYQQPSTYLRPPAVVMPTPLAPNQYYNMDYYPYPSNPSGVAMATSQHVPPHYDYHGDNRIEKQLYSCLNCGSKYPEFDMLAQHFRDNTCNNTTESIVSCCPQRHY